MTQQSIPQPEALEPAVDVTRRLLGQLDRVLLGRSDLHRMVLVGILSRGHILLEGQPGVGKTALVKALGDLMRLKFSRVQFTPDLMPSDILGSHILQQDDQGRREMSFTPGPIFTNILLADEINRASPKTQSALLEAMQEHHVTLMGSTRKLPDPFFVLASQNPIELEGTYPLPEAQLDRFLFKLRVHGADVDVMDGIISSRRRGEPPAVDWSMEADELESLFAMMEQIFLPRPVGRYISRLVAATHPGTGTGTGAGSGAGAHSGAGEATEQVEQYVNYGASPRAAIAMAEASRAHALISGRPTVGFEDVRTVAPAVLNHRIILNYKARFDRVDTYTVIGDLLASMDETGLNLPTGMEVTGAES